MDTRVEKILLTYDEIQAGIIKAAKWIDQKFKDKDLILIGLLKGCIPFYGQLASHITIDCLLDTMTISSYKGNTERTTLPHIYQDVTEDIKDKDVLIVDEIIDSAYTLQYVKDYLNKNYGPKSISILTLLDKPEGRKIDLNPDYSCFQIENHFVVGYGCDYQGKLRNLPYVGIFKQK
ncbi:MAG: hypoxanthine phosphoribosyltransferase [Malacoplasma sp.]|nr:hypoxanthine phosphoribosyltransferase [Malacoplasma sp.]